jgi:hypothetical protein
MNALALLKTGARMVRWRELRATIAYCPICDARRPFVRLQAGGCRFQGRDRITVQEKTAIRLEAVNLPVGWNPLV